MATEAQIEANRANAQKSTGPRTPEGKAAVAQNAQQLLAVPQQEVARPGNLYHRFRIDHRLAHRLLFHA